MKISELEFKTNIIEELSVIKAVAEIIEGKLAIISKDDIKTLLGKSPDFADMIMMRMYFELKKNNMPIGIGGFPTKRKLVVNKSNM